MTETNPGPINIVHPGSGWILTRIAERVKREDPSNFHLIEVSEKMELLDNDPAAIIYVDVQNCWNPQFKALYPNAKHIGYFTHIDKDSFREIYPRWHDYLQLDAVIHMCTRYRDKFAAAGFEGPQIVNHAADIDNWQLERLRLGVFQRGGFPGKGDGFLQDVFAALSPETVSGLSLYLKGSGWKKAEFRSDLYLTLDVSEGYRSYGEAYRDVDYVLIPSLWEGGPMGFVEALAQGKPVIASEVGWIPDIGGATYTFQPNDVEGLATILRRLVEVRLDRRKRVQKLTYDALVDDIYGLMETLQAVEEPC